MRSNKEQGFTTAWMLGLVMIVLVIGGAFYDFSGALTQRQKLISIADRASNSGATALDEQALIDSNGDEVDLRIGSPSPPPPDETAKARCEDVLFRESQLDNSIITTFSCDPDPTDPDVIVANVNGRVSYGVIASWLGVDGQNFNVISRARPSCSDATDPVSGAC